MHYTYRCEYVRCGKAACRSCPHGPYWYSYWREEGRVRKRYHGKADPRVRKGAHTRGEQVHADPREAIFDRGRATMQLACRILNLAPGAERAFAQREYKKLCLANHPDRGGDPVEMQYINAAWSFYRAHRGW